MITIIVDFVFTIIGLFWMALCFNLISKIKVGSVKIFAIILFLMISVFLTNLSTLILESL